MSEKDDPQNDNKLQNTLKCLDCKYYIHYWGYMDKQGAIESMTALSQRTRLDAFRLLIKAGKAGMAAGEVGEKLGVVQNTMSAHLATLKNAGLIRRERQSRTIRYYANYDAMRGLLGFLMEDCCGGRPELCDPMFTDDLCKPTLKQKSKHNV